MQIADVIDRFRSFGEPRSIDDGSKSLYACEVSGPAAPTEIAAAWGDADLPPDIVDLWLQCREARLFVDVTFGQWGLALLSPGASAEQTSIHRRLRASDLWDSDLVVGKFIGDQELLIVAPAETGERRVLVASEIDPRAEWPAVGPHIADFLSGYWERNGEKYWD